MNQRRPTAFAANDPKVIIAEPDIDADLLQVAATEATLPAKLPDATAPPRRRWRWGTLFWSALGGLATLALGLAVTRLVDDLFARSLALGWLGLSLAIVAALSSVVIVIREIRGLLRLSTIEEVRDDAAATLISDNRDDGLAVVRSLLHLTRRTPRLARARKTLSAHLDDIIDGADFVRLAERHLMTPLDREARQLVSSAAKRVSIVTAVSPRAAIDIFFVLITVLGLIRRLAYLYGGRPGALGLIRLMRMCIAHLTVTGGLAVSDGLVQQVLGHGVVAKLSSRLGEGMLNGLLTARLGLAAIETIRPLPFAALTPPKLGDLAAELTRQRDIAE
jgi:putative membrane protein